MEILDVTKNIFYTNNSSERKILAIYPSWGCVCVPFHIVQASTGHTNRSIRSKSAVTHLLQDRICFARENEASTAQKRLNIWCDWHISPQMLSSWWYTHAYNQMKLIHKMERKVAHKSISMSRCVHLMIHDLCTLNTEDDPWSLTARKQNSWHFHSRLGMPWRTEQLIRMP